MRIHELDCELRDSLLTVEKWSVTRHFFPMVLKIIVGREPWGGIGTFKVAVGVATLGVNNAL
jgi:hypothetical protein